jgi:hypothetical protein
MRPLDLMDTHQQILMRWASNVAWLLEQRYLQPDSSDLSNAYLSELVGKGIVKRTGSIRKVREGTLTEALNDYFPSAFLDLYGPNRGGRCNKPYQSIKRLLRGDYVHPAHHLIMIEFLGHTAESFFEKLPHTSLISNHHKPFGDAPWPCLNPASSHFRKLKIYNCRAIKSESSKAPLVGIFACADCGFAYRRRGPDTVPSDRLRFNNVKTYGHVWDKALTKLWNNNSISTIKIANQLGVRDLTIRHQALRLGLYFPRLGPRSSVTHVTTADVEKTARRQAERLSQLRTFREVWLSEQKGNPGITRTELAKRVRRIYSWLYLHDYEWLEAHKPPTNYSRDSHRVDWKG